MRTYTVKAGDTLSRIAQLHYGNASLYQLIADANGIANPDLISTGTTLTIPDLNPAAPSDTILGNVDQRILILGALVVLALVLFREA